MCSSRNIRKFEAEFKSVVYMKTMSNNYCVILAGGKGRRLWPYSRDRRPKQFIDFFGCGRTQLQLTFDRIAKLLPKDNIIVCTNAEYADMTHEQLPEVYESNFIIEEVGRNTAPSVTLATFMIQKRNSDANIIVTPSDQFVLNEDAYAENVRKAFDFVSKNEKLLVMAVKPTRPEPGYGYIQIGDNMDTSGVFSVKSFTEKPEREFAQMFMDSGEFYWNTGLFLGSAKCFSNSFPKMFPEMHNRYEEERKEGTPSEKETFARNNYSSFPNLSVDYGVLERCCDICVMTCDFGWADLGTWHSIYECMSKGTDDNVVVDSKVILDDSHNNVIKVSKGKLAVINGLDGYIVVEQDNVLFICKRGDTSSLIRT